MMLSLRIIYWLEINYILAVKNTRIHFFFFFFSFGYDSLLNVILDHENLSEASLEANPLAMHFLSFQFLTAGRNCDDVPIGVETGKSCGGPCTQLV
jgi:hypothetical protein